MTDPPQLAPGGIVHPTSDLPVMVGQGPPEQIRPIRPNTWWLCPNTPPCPHGAVFHDINDYDDPSPTCCAGDCTCGHTP